MNAISTYKVFLMRKSSGVYSKLVDIKSFPDLGGSPENLETTTLTDGSRTYIPGIQEQESMEFTTNYNLVDYTALKALEGTEHDLAVWFGADGSGSDVTPTGADGRFEFKGRVTISVSGGGVNEVVDMTITVTPSTPIDLATNGITRVVLNKTSVAADNTAKVSVSAVNYIVTPGSTPSLAYLWQIRDVNGTSWTDLTNSYTGYNTDELTVKSTDAGKHYRCKVTATGSVADICFSNECTVASS